MKCHVEQVPKKEPLSLNLIEIVKAQTIFQGNYTRLFIVKNDNPSMGESVSEQDVIDLFKAGLPSPIRVVPHTLNDSAFMAATKWDKI